MMTQPTFEERREARRNLSNLRNGSILERWQHEARETRRRHAQWCVNPFVSFTPREAAIDDLSLQLAHDARVREVVTPGVNWTAMAEAVLASTPREPGTLRMIGDGVWRAMTWTFMTLTARARQAEAQSMRLSVVAHSGEGAPHGIAA